MHTTPAGLRRLALAALITLGVASVAVLGLSVAMFWTTDMARGRLYFRALIGVVGAQMIAFAAKSFLFDAARSRRPRWRRIRGAVEFLAGAYLLMVAFKGW